MSTSIFRHLCGIACLKQYNYTDDEAFRREMYFLRDNGFIEPTKSSGFLDFNASLEGRNLVEIAKLTPIGRSCVKLREEEARGLLQLDLTNVRVYPADL